MISQKPCAVILGGTNPHIILINKLKERGYYTILVDFLENPPAKEVADLHIMESTLDMEKVLEIAKHYHAQLVISTNIDHANVTACYVGEVLNLPHPYSYQTALNVTNKLRMKKIMKDHSIPTSDYVIMQQDDERKLKNLKYPLIMKPVDSNGSRGVYKIENNYEFHHFFSDSLKYSKDGSVIIEEYKEGIEVSFYYFVNQGRVIYVTSNQRIHFKEEKKAMQNIGGIYPVQCLDANGLKKMKQIAQKIVDAFELDNTPIFIQSIVNGDSIYVIEFAPRIGGGLSYRLIEKDNKFDIIDATIDSFLGKKNIFNIASSIGFSAVINIYAKGGVMGEISGVGTVKSKNTTVEFYQYLLKNASISYDLTSGSRVGAFYFRTNNYNEIFEMISFINQNIEVYDKYYNRIMYHELYK